MDIALLVLAAVSLFVNLTAILVFLFLLFQTSRDVAGGKMLTQINTGKIAGIEKLALSTYTLLMQDMMGVGAGPGPRPGPSGPPSDWESMGIGREDGNFITEDGVHSAPTFEELMQKITSDPRYRVSRPEDIAKLRQQFEDFNDEYGPPTGPGDDQGEGSVDGDEWKDSDGS